MNDYIERLKAMVSELEEHPDIDVEKFVVSPPATDDEINAARDYKGLTDDMESFYRAANGFELKWSYTGDHAKLYDQEADGRPRPVEGSIVLYAVQDTFKDQRDVVYSSEDDKTRQMHPIDHWVEEGYASLNLDGSDEPEVYYHSASGENLSTLRLTFSGYLEKLLKSRGFWYWHKSIAAPEYFNPYAPTTYEEDGFRAIMPKLFDDYSNADFLRVDGHGNEEHLADSGGSGGGSEDEGGGVNGVVVAGVGVALILLIGGGFFAFIMVMFCLGCLASL